MLDEGDLRELAGHPVVDRDGKSVGYVDQIFNDDQTGEPEWIGVITGTFRHHVHLVPASGVGQEDGRYGSRGRRIECTTRPSTVAAIKEAFSASATTDLQSPKRRSEWRTPTTGSQRLRS